MEAGTVLLGRGQPEGYCRGRWKQQRDGPSSSSWGRGSTPRGQDSCRGRGTKDRLHGTLSCSHSSVAVPQEPGTRQEGAGRATPPPKQAQGSPQRAATYSSRRRQPAESWAGGEGEPAEREETRLLLQAAAAPPSQQASGGSASQPCWGTSPPPSLLPTLQHPGYISCSVRPGRAVILSKGSV